jgi:hypothetical protein
LGGNFDRSHERGIPATPLHFEVRIASQKERSGPARFWLRIARHGMEKTSAQAW